MAQARLFEEFDQKMKEILARGPAADLEKNLRAESEEALALAQKAVELAPQNPAGRNILGRILLNRNDVEGAIQHLETGIRIAPLSREMRFELARAYAKAGRTEDASAFGSGADHPVRVATPSASSASAPPAIRSFWPVCLGMVRSFWTCLD